MFVDRAIKSRKYPESTGAALKAALKLFEKELTPEEADSIDLFKDHLEQIYHTVYSKNSDFSASSLATYRSRVKKVLDDYSKYGEDPTKMANWNPKWKTPSVRKSPTPLSSAKQDEAPPTSHPSSLPDGMHRVELSLRPTAKVILEVPHDITITEATTIKAILDSLVAGSLAVKQYAVPEAPRE